MRVFIVTLLFNVLLMAEPSHEQYVYYHLRDKVFRCQLDGSGHEQVHELSVYRWIMSSEYIVGPNEAVAYCETYDYITRVDLLNGGETTFDFDFPSNRDWTVDRTQRYIFWENYGTIKRYDMVSQVTETMFSQFTQVTTLKISPQTNQLYFWDEVSRTIYRANIDGTGLEVIVDSPESYNLQELDFHPNGDLVWYTRVWSSNQNNFYMSNADGSGLEQLRSYNDINGIELKVITEDEICFMSNDFFVLIRMNIESQRFKKQCIADYSILQPKWNSGGLLNSELWLLAWNNDDWDSCLGSNISISEMVEHVNLQWSCCPLPSQREPLEMVWHDAGQQALMYANLTEGTTELLIDNLSGDGGVAFVWQSDDVFFADNSNSALMKYNLKTQNLEVVLSNIGEVTSIAYDGVEGIFWIDGDESAIKSVPVQGGSTQIAVPGIDQAGGLAIDVASEYLFWCDKGDHSIWRASKWGSNLTRLAVTTDEPCDITIDPLQERVYWTEPSGQRISSFDFNGLNYEFFSPMESPSPQSIFFDKSSNLLYWTDSINGEMFQSSSNGLFVESVLENINSDMGLAFVTQTVDVPTMKPWVTGLLILLMALTSFLFLRKTGS